MNKLFSSKQRVHTTHTHTHHLLSRAYIALHVMLVIIPLAVIITWSFSAAWSWPHLVPDTLSLKGFQELFRPEQHTGQALLLSVGIALATAILTTIIAICAARSFTCHRFAGQRLFEFAFTLPFLIPSTVFAMGTQVIFIRMGLAGSITGVVLAHSIVALPYTIIIMTESMAAVGTKLESAARLCGANTLSAFRHATLPRLIPGIVSSCVMAYIVSFSQYFLTLLIGGGTVKTFTLAMFPYLTGGDRTIASAYGLIFLLVTLGVFLLINLVLKLHIKRPTRRSTSFSTNTNANTHIGTSTNTSTSTHPYGTD